PIAEVLAVLVLVGRGRGRNRVERGPAIRRHLDVGVVPTTFDLVSGLERQADRTGPERDRSGHRVVEVVARPRVVEVAPGERRADVLPDLLVRQHDEDALFLFGVRADGADLV